MIVFIAVAFGSYLIGSVPFGYIIARLAGVDITSAGSGNIGATNVLRVLGKKYGYAVFLLDFFKGTAAVALSILVAKGFQAGAGQLEMVEIIAGVFCVVGHAYPVWLAFKGGKGVATSAGVLVGLMPLTALIAGIVWLITFKVTKYVSLASVMAALSLPIVALRVTYFGKENRPVFVYFCLCLAVVVVWRHRSNLSRLSKGTEPSFRQK